MNEDRLSEREHGEMRDILLAGTQRVRPAGATRAQIIAGAVALLLVGGITGGAVTTAALINGGTVATTPTPTQSDAPPRPAPTPTPTVPPVVEPAVGVEPFGGECANVLTDDEVGRATGIAMMRSDYRWKTGANTTLGGIDCVWVSDGVYLAATVHVFAYPEAVVARAVKEAPNGCVPVEGEGDDELCVSTDVVGGTWLQVRVRGAGDGVSEEGTAQLLASATARLDDHAAPLAADPQDGWWALPDCEQLVTGIDPGLYGFERVALLDQQGMTAPDTSAESIPVTARATSTCLLHFTAGEGDDTSGEVVEVSVVPGGAVAFPTASGRQDAVPVTVAGAQGAVIAPGLDRYEGSPSVLVVSDGVNILMVTPDMVRDAAEAAPLAAALLALMHP